MHVNLWEVLCMELEFRSSPKYLIYWANLGLWLCHLLKGPFPYRNEDIFYVKQMNVCIVVVFFFYM